MSNADRFTQAREAALRAARANAERDAATRSGEVDDATTGEFSAATAAAPITVLTTDAELCEAVRRAVLDQHEVALAETLEQAAALAASGKCALLITDQALTIEASNAIAEQLRKHEPAMVSIAVGGRGQDGVLLQLMTAQAVDRFMLKPITPALARIVIEAASKEHASRKPRKRGQPATAEVPAFTMRRAAPPKSQKRARDKSNVTQPVRVLPAAQLPARAEPTHAEDTRAAEVRVETAAAEPARVAPAREDPASVEQSPAQSREVEPLQAEGQAQSFAYERTPDEHPEDHTVLVPALTEPPPELESVQARAEAGHVHSPTSDTPPEDTRTVLARESLDIEMPPQPPQTATSAFERTGIARPPWFVLVAAMLAAGALVWWIMLQRLPDIDPRQLIGSNLSAAQAALAAQRYLEPSNQSAFHHFSTVLALDPANAEAKAGIDKIAEHYLGRAQALIGQGRFAEAVSDLQSVRRVRPDDERVAALEGQLRDRLAQQFPQIRKPIALDPRSVAGVVGAASEAPAPAVARAPSSPRAAKAKEKERPAAVSESRSPAPPAVDARVIADARQAIERRDFVVAHTLIDAALEMGAPPEEVLTLNHALTAAEQSAVPPAPAPQMAAAERASQTTPASAPAFVAAPAVAPAAEPARPEPPVQPVLVKMVQPRYPDEARLRGMEGWVDLSFVVSAAGDVTDPRVEDSSMKHLFARPALAAVRQWKYEPRKMADPSQRTHARVQFKLVR